MAMLPVKEILNIVLTKPTESPHLRVTKSDMERKMEMSWLRITPCSTKPWEKALAAELANTWHWDTYASALCRNISSECAFHIVKCVLPSSVRSLPPPIFSFIHWATFNGACAS